MVILRSVFDDRVAIWAQDTICVSSVPPLPRTLDLISITGKGRKEGGEAEKRAWAEIAQLTREMPGLGVASVLMMIESLSDFSGLGGTWYEEPFTLTAWRTDNDQTPRAPPIACSFRFVRVGRSRCNIGEAESVSNFAVLRNFAWAYMT